MESWPELGLGPQLGPEKAPGTDPFYLRTEDLKGETPKAHYLGLFHVSKASPIHRVALHHLGPLLTHMQFSAQQHNLLPACTWLPFLPLGK